MNKRILLADDQMAVRSGLKLLLEQEPGFQIVGEAADATGLLLVVATTTVAEKPADLVLLDWELPGLPIDQLLRLLKWERPFLKIIAMSSHPEARQAALNASVHAFVSKNEPPERVLAMIRTLW